MMASLGEDVVEMIACAYEAGAEPSRWPEFLARVGDAIGDRSCTLQIEDLASASGTFAYAIRVDPSDVAAYASRYAAINPWTRRGAADLQPGAVLVGEMALSTRDLERTEFYADFLRPQDISHSLAAVVERAGERAAFMGFQRSKKRGPWSKRDIALVRALMPHVKRAIDLHHRLGVRRQREESFAQTIEHVPWGVVLVDRRRRVVHVNARASAFDRRTLDRVLAAADRGGGIVAISEAQRLSVTTAPLHVDDPLVGEGPVLAIFVVDPGADRPVPHTTLRRAYGLTPAEARLAVAVSRGESVREVSELTGVKQATLRTHLKRIFEKTGVRRQSELVRLVLLLSRAG